MIDGYIDKFDGKRTGSDSAMIRCPCHGGKRFNLGITDVGRENIIFNCFAGCSFGEIIPFFKDAGLWKDNRYKEDYKEDIKRGRSAFIALSSMLRAGHYDVDDIREQFKKISNKFFYKQVLSNEERIRFEELYYDCLLRHESE
jgi:hypothetical protein